MGKYLSWDKLLDQWNLDDFELLDFINNGLIPYNHLHDAVPVRIVNRKKLPDGFLNSIGRRPTREELKGVELNILKAYAHLIFGGKGYFPNTQDILKNLPKYIIENMVQELLPLKARRKKTQTTNVFDDYDDITITIDLKKPETFQRLHG